MLQFMKLFTCRNEVNNLGSLNCYLANISKNFNLVVRFLLFANDQTNLPLLPWLCTK